jgi:hypothetical protein
MKKLCFISLAVLLMNSIEQVAMAQSPTPGVRPGGSTMSQQKMPPSARRNLTSGECTALGGKIDDNANCTGKGCYTVDQHGVMRVACIDEKKN